MAKTKKEKKVLLENYKSKIESSKGFIVVKPSKLTPKEVTEFRKELFDANALFSVVKNSIFKLALKDLKLPEIESFTSTEHAILFFGEDMVTPSKSLKKFIEATKSKEGDVKIQIVTGVLEGEALSAEQVEELAEMPDKRGSISLILGILDASLAGVLNVLEDAPRSYVSIIDQAFKE